MDTLDTQQSSSDLRLDPQHRSSLYRAGIWARFVGYVTIAFGILYALFTLYSMYQVSVAMSNIQGMNPSFNSSMSSGIFTFQLVFVILYLAVFVLLGVLLIKFGSNAVKGIANNSAELIAKSFKGLSGYFIVIGILTALAILIVIFVAIFIGAMWR